MHVRSGSPPPSALHSSSTLFRVTFKSTTNRKVVARLIQEVCALNPSYDGADIRGINYGVCVYFCSTLPTLLD